MPVFSHCCWGDHQTNHQNPSLILHSKIIGSTFCLLAPWRQVGRDTDVTDGGERWSIPEQNASNSWYVPIAPDTKQDPPHCPRYITRSCFLAFNVLRYFCHANLIIIDYRSIIDQCNTFRSLLWFPSDTPKKLSTNRKGYRPLINLIWGL